MIYVTVPRMFARTTAACSIAAAIVMGAATNASGATGSELFDNINISGVATDIASGTTSTLSATLDLNNIQLAGSTTNTLIVTGSLTGSVTDADGITTNLLNQLFTTSGSLVNVSNNGKKCGLINMEFEGLELDLLGLDLAIDPATIDVAGTRGKGRKLGNTLCKLTRFVDAGHQIQIDKTINKINGIIGSPTENLGISGDLIGGGSFSGFVTIEGARVEGSSQLVITGTINGVATADGLTTVVANESFTTTATVSGTSLGFKGKKCDTIVLKMGTLTLEGPDVEIELGELMLETSGIKGPGKQLTKTLCQVAKALDDKDNGKSKPEKLLKKIRKAADKLNKLLLNL